MAFRGVATKSLAVFVRGWAVEAWEGTAVFIDLGFGFLLPFVCFFEFTSAVSSFSFYFCLGGVR